MARKHIDTAAYKQELLDTIAGLPDFDMTGMDLFNIEDFKDRANLMDMPAFGVAYTGAGLVENEGAAVGAGGSSSTLITLYFRVIIVVEYTSGDRQDSVSHATDVLDRVRRAVYGFRGIGSRVWKFTGESPYAQIGEGTVYYLQDWSIDAPLIGDSNA